MSLYNLDAMFNPASIAVVGASRTSGSIGQIVMNSLIEGDFEGEIFAVNPEYDQILILE